MELSIGKRFTVDLTTEEVGRVMELIDGFDDPDVPVIRSPFKPSIPFSVNGEKVEVNK